MENSIEQPKVATSDHQPAAEGATVVAAATHERVNSLYQHEAQTQFNPRTTEGRGSQTKLLLKVKEAAALLGVSTTTIRRLIARGELAVNRKLRHVLIPRSELERFASGGAR